MALGVGVLTVALVAVWVYCILDVISTPDGAHRNLPKPAWLVIVILLPTVGSLAWLVAGRPRRAGPGRPARQERPGWPHPPRPTPRPRGPDDDPDFLRGL